MEYYPRIIEEKLEKWLPRKEVILLKGPRQSGKTTLLKHLQEKYGGAYISLEIEDYAKALKTDPLLFAQRFMERKILYLDEAQYLKDIGKYVKIIYDHFGQKLKLIITGSGSFEIKENLGRYLVGRAIYFELYPLNFVEFLLWKNKELLVLYQEYQKNLWEFIEGKTHKLKQPVFEGEFTNLLEEFIVFGGYPAVVKEKDIEVKKEILKNLVQTYLEKDIFFFLNIRQLEKFKDFLKILAFNTGNIIDLSSLSREIKLDYKTTQKYLDVLINTYVIGLLSPFHKNLVTEIKKSKKVYFLDTGLRNAILSNFQRIELRLDRGTILENFVYKELTKKGISTKFWRTTGKAEVDFILLKDEAIFPIEVKYTPKIRKSLYSFLKKYNLKRALILNFANITKLEKKNSFLIGFAPCFYI